MCCNFNKNGVILLVLNALVSGKSHGPTSLHKGTDPPSCYVNLIGTRLRSKTDLTCCKRETLFAARNRSPIGTSKYFAGWSVVARRSMKIACRDGLMFVRLSVLLSACLNFGSARWIFGEILYERYDVLCHSTFARYWQSVLEKWRTQEIVRNTTVQVSTV